MRVYLGSDHAGFELKAQLVAWLGANGHEPIDCGPPEYDAEDDYPPYVIAAAERAVRDTGSVAVVIGGSGNGEQIAANKVEGVRAALCWSPEIATLSRQHNDANVCSLGSRFHDRAAAEAIVEAFVVTEFSGAARHVRRIALISDYETSGSLSPADD
ncbi:MAG: ribose-5-phosphate isomerase [Mycobacteriales bacterium]